MQAGLDAPSSGPSGKHRQVSGDELVAQRRAIVADLPEALRRLIDLKAPLPVGMAPRIAAALGRKARSAAQTIGKMWAGKRRYRTVS